MHDLDVTITKEYWEKGKRKSCSDCALALVLKEELLNPRVSVQPFRQEPYVRIYSEQKNIPDRFYGISEEVAKEIREWDSGIEKTSELKVDLKYLETIPSQASKSGLW